MPPVFRVIEDTPATLEAFDAPVVHFAIADEVTTDTGPRLSDVYVEWTGAGEPQNVEVRFSGGDIYRAELPVRESPGGVSWRVCATDRAGNQACSPPKTYDAEGDLEPLGKPDPMDDEGCGCRLSANESRVSAWLGLGAIALLRLRRRGRLTCGR